MSILVPGSASVFVLHRIKLNVLVKGAIKFRRFNVLPKPFSKLGGDVYNLVFR